MTVPEFVANEQRQVVIKKELYESFFLAVNGIVEWKKPREVSGVLIEIYKNGVLFRQKERLCFWSIDQLANFLTGYKKGVYTLKGLEEQTKKIHKALEDKELPEKTIVIAIDSNWFYEAGFQALWFFICYIRLYKRRSFGCKINFNEVIRIKTGKTIV